MNQLLLIVGYLMSWALIPHILLARKSPAATLAWVWFVLLFPYMGTAAYLLLGADRIAAPSANEFFPRSESNLAVPPWMLPLTKPGAREILSTLAHLTRTPSSWASSPRLLSDAHAFYPALAEAISKAKFHVHFQSFLLRNDEVGRKFITHLCGAARRGVTVRLLLDRVGCLGIGKDLFTPLIQAGGKVGWFHHSPLPWRWRLLNLRNHRKLQIIDHSRAFIGGMNIGDEYLGPPKGSCRWRDLQIEVGGAVVALLEEKFAEDWHLATRERIATTRPPRFPSSSLELARPCQIVWGGPDFRGATVCTSLVALINFARTRIWIATGYFAPNESLLVALHICAARGGDVRLLISEKSDHPYLIMAGRSYYEDMLGWGVRIFEYSPAVNHTKAVLIDDNWVMVGSANCDQRSLELNFELNLLIHCPETARALACRMQEDFDLSREILRPEFLKRPLHQRLLEAAVRPLGPLF
jgi:cardiolipin synthase